MSNQRNDIIRERLWEEAEFFVDQKMKLNPTIPTQARLDLIEEKYLQLCKNMDFDIEPVTMEEMMDDDSEDDLKEDLWI